MKKRYNTEELSLLIKSITESGETVKFTVTGNSMYPLLLSNRDEVFVKKRERYKKGNVVLYLRENNQCVLHRIIYVDKIHKTYTICGDNQMILEENVPFDAVIGEACSFIRKGIQFSKNNILYGIYVFVWVHGFKLRRVFVSDIKKMYKFQ